MKIFQKYNRTEGDIYKPNTFFSFGSSTLSTGAADGWFIKLEFPLSRNMKFVNWENFNPDFGPCRYHILYRRRPNGNHYLRKGWYPTKPEKLT